MVPRPNLGRGPFASTRKNIMSIISTILASPVTNQMEHTSDLTVLYWLALPVVAVIAGVGYLIKRGRSSHEAKHPTRLAIEQARLTEWRRIVTQTGLSPVHGKSAEQAIEEQEQLCRDLWALQSGLHSGSPEGGRKPSTNRKGR